MAGKGQEMPGDRLIPEIFLCVLLCPFLSLCVLFKDLRKLKWEERETGDAGSKIFFICYLPLLSVTFCDFQGVTQIEMEAGPCF